MKINIPADWLLGKAHLEEGHEIGAGLARTMTARKKQTNVSTHRHRRPAAAGSSSAEPAGQTGQQGMKVLVACEFSGVVRDAFLVRGHDAMSCDLLPTEVPGPHYQGDLFEVIDYPWDIAIFHPPCTHLAVSGARHFAEKKMDGRQQAAAAFFLRLTRVSAHIPHTAIENPICIMSSLWRQPDQIIQPWQFGHGETKATCLWLKNLPKLQATEVVEGRDARIHRMPPSEGRWKERSRTFVGIASAMADQWGREGLL